MIQNKESKRNLRSKKSHFQQMKPRQSICSGCPHTYDVKNKTCDIGDLEMFGLEEPHICHQERDGLCRGVVEKMIMNDMAWDLENEKS